VQIHRHLSIFMDNFLQYFAFVLHFFCLDGSLWLVLGRRGGMNKSWCKRSLPKFRSLSFAITRQWCRLMLGCTALCPSRFGITPLCAGTWKIILHKQTWKQFLVQWSSFIFLYPTNVVLQMLSFFSFFYSSKESNTGGFSMIFLKELGTEYQDPCNLGME
jgi:hypothetical protein